MVTDTSVKVKKVWKEVNLKKKKNVFFIRYDILNTKNSLQNGQVIWKLTVIYSATGNLTTKVLSNCNGSGDLFVKATGVV